MVRAINEKGLNALYHADPTARGILEVLASMPKQNETIMDKLEDKLRKEGQQVDRRTLVTFFKRLEDFGAGEFLVGRKGHPSRFQWEVDSIQIATHDVSFPTTEHRTQSDVEFPLPVGPTVLISHRYQLRPELIVSLQLPADLNITEAHRLSQFVLSLPFQIDAKVGV